MSDQDSLTTPHPRTGAESKRVEPEAPSLVERLTDRIMPAFCGTSFTEPELQDLTEQFHTSLRASFATIAPPGPESATNEAAYRQVAALLDENRECRPSWKDAYDAEQQLIHLYGPTSVHIEIQRRLLDAGEHLEPQVAQWYQQQLKRDPPPTTAEQRCLLSRLVSDLQWRYTIDQTRRRFMKQVTGRTEIIFALSVSLFVGMIMFLISQVVGVTANEPESNLHGVSSPTLMLAFVGFTGAFGAAFSMMTSLRTRLTVSSFADLKLNRSWMMLLARVLVGIGAGFVFFYVIRSHLVAGEAFPNLDWLDTTTADTPPDRVQLAKLFIWCFLAGFSEKLVPNILTRTAESVDTKPLAQAHLAPANPNPIQAPVRDPEDSAAPTGDPATTGAGSGDPPEKT